MKFKIQFVFKAELLFSHKTTDYCSYKKKKKGKAKRKKNSSTPPLILLFTCCLSSCTQLPPINLRPVSRKERCHWCPSARCLLHLTKWERGRWGAVAWEGDGEGTQSHRMGVCVCFTLTTSSLSYIKLTLFGSERKLQRRKTQKHMRWSALKTHTLFLKHSRGPLRDLWADRKK